jgi:mannose-6-phosphate isomerase-like protein (cupin superfamily)
MNRPPRRYRVVDFDQIPGVSCPCGVSRRAFADVPELPATVHRTEITHDAKPHYHRRTTETYYVLHCAPEAKIQLDGDLVSVKPGTCVVIPPGVVHRAVGPMTILNIVIPKFDPGDEVLVEEGT